MTAPAFGKWSLVDYLTHLLALFAVAAGIILIVDRSLRTQVIQLHPAQQIANLMWWGIPMLALGVATGLRHYHPRASRIGVGMLTVEATFLALCNIGEAISLAERPGPQLGWLGAAVWAFIALTALGIARSNEQAA